MAESSNNLARMLPAICWLLAAGCAGTGAVTLPVLVEHERGRLRWEHPAGDRLLADAWFARDSNDSLTLMIGRENPALRLELDGASVRARGRLAGGNWSGDRGAAGPALAGWIALLEAWDTARNLPDGTQEVHASTYRARFEKSSGRLQLLLVRPTLFAETFQVTFGPG